MKKKTDFPSREEIEEVLKEMEEDEKKGGLIRRLLPPHASHIDVLKEALCEEVIRYKLTYNPTNIELAQLLEIDPARVSEILYAKIELYSVDRLMEIVSRLAKYDKSLEGKLNKMVGALKASS